MSFTDFIRLQNDWAHVLLSDDWLASVNVVTRERLVLDAAAMEDQTLAAEILAYTVARAGRHGCGIIVEKPELVATLPNVPGPQGDLLFTFLVLEDPLENESPTLGTQKAADQVAQKILDIGHIFTSQGDGVYRADANAMSAARDWEPLRAYRVRLRIANNRGQTQRVATPQVAISGTISISTPTAGAAIYYTTDGSCPASSNPTAQLYTSPLTLSAGTILRAAAFKSGMIQSAITKVTT